MSAQTSSQMHDLGPLLHKRRFSGHTGTHRRGHKVKYTAITILGQHIMPLCCCKGQGPNGCPALSKTATQTNTQTPLYLLHRHLLQPLYRMCQ